MDFKKIINYSILALLAYVQSALLHANSGGYIGAGATREILPNIVDLIFSNNNPTQVTIEELKLAEEKLERGLNHTKQFITEMYDSPSEYKDTARDNLRKELLDSIKYQPKEGSDISVMAEQWLRDNYQNWDSFTPVAKELTLKDEIDIMRSKYAKFDPALAQRLLRQLDDQKQQQRNFRIAYMMKLIGLSPDIIARVYRNQEIMALKQADYYSKTSNVNEVPRYLEKAKMARIIATQAQAVARAKYEVTRLTLIVAKEKRDSDLAKSQVMINVFNSIYIDGYAYGSKRATGATGTTSVAEAHASQRIGEIIALCKKSTKTQVENILSTTAILDAQAGKYVVGNLYRDLVPGMGDAYDDMLAYPSDQAQVNTRQKIIEYEQDVESGRPYVVGRALVNLERWRTYGDLLDISMACDNLVEQTLLNAISNQEQAKKLFRQNIRQLLGAAVSITASSYFHF